MQKDTVTKTLRSLAEGDRSRSETARLRDVLPEIEAALGAGVKRSAILEALQGQGFTMTLKSFESALYRLRKAKPEHKAVKTQPQPAIKPEVSTPQPEETKPPQQKTGPLANLQIDKPARFKHNPTPDKDLLG